MKRVLTLLLLLSISASAFASGDLFVTTTSYEVFGGTAQISILPPYSSVIDAYQIHSDAVVREYGKRWAFVVNRLFADNILVLDRNTGFGVVTQYSTSPTGLNPRDIHVEPVSTPGSGPGRAFITLYESNSLMVCDALTGANRNTIDLSSFADGDGLCEMDQLLEVPSAPGFPDGLLLVSLQRQDRGGAIWIAGDAVLAVIDIATESLVDTNPGTPDIDGIPLQLRNPFWRMEWAFVDGAWKVLVNCPGDYGVDDGGIEVVDPYTYQSEGVLVSDGDLGGDVLDFQIMGTTLGWAITNNSSFQTSLVRFDPTTAQVSQTVLTSAGFDLVDLEMSFDGRLFVGDRDAGNPGVRIYDPVGGSLLAGPLNTGLPPFDFVLLDEIPVDAPPIRLANRLTASPNPFNPRVKIRLEPAGAGTILEILDLRGRRVARVAGEADGSGTSWIWDGTNARGESVASGAYFARVEGIDVPPIKLMLVR
jgi:hypothetical protein